MSLLISSDALTYVFGSMFFPDDTELPLVCQVDLDLLPSPIECLLAADPVVLL